MPRRFRRRFLVGALLVLVVLVGTGIGIGVSLKGGQWRDEDRRRGPGPLVGIAVLVGVVGSGATWLAYRRLSRPLSQLLEAAERLSHGDYGVKVEPEGPRELRSLATTLNDMAARLGVADEQRRRFLADVTHELRTPLAVLQSEIEAQLDGIHPRDDEYLASLLEETELLGRLVDDLHTLALADAGRLALHYERTHPASLVQDAVDSHRVLAERKGVTISVSAPPSLPEMDVDPTRVRQVLANLLSNAIRHAPSGSTVGVSLEATDGAVTFKVRDSGPGIPDDQLPRIFDRFVRSADSRGSGLGLSIARDLVQAHGGSVRGENVPGGGTAIVFTVPTGRDAGG